MAANLRTLKKNWLRDAAEDGRNTPEQQLEWLKAQRRILSPAVRAGDWAVTNKHLADLSTTALRNVTGEEHLSALTAALEEMEGRLGLSDAPGTGAMLSFSVQNICN